MRIAPTTTRSVRLSGKGNDVAIDPVAKAIQDQTAELRKTNKILEAMNTNIVAIANVKLLGVVDARAEREEETDASGN